MARIAQTSSLVNRRVVQLIAVTSVLGLAMATGLTNFVHARGSVVAGVGISQSFRLTAVVSNRIKTPTTGSALATAPIATNVPAAVATPQVPAPSSCAPSTYIFPSLVSLSAAPNGLSVVVDPVSQYQIYGNTTAQIRQQIQTCAPRPSGSNQSVSEYTGQAGFQVSWSYDITSESDGSCSVGDAKIGMHVGVVVPNWQATATTTPGLNARMQAFIAALNMHEQGHVQLSQQYADQMMADLQSFPSSRCTIIQASIQAALQRDINALEAANAAYDTATNHGATQGAVLPS